MSHTKSSDQNQSLRGELFLVATPIGNLGDITLALETLKSVTRIACEDTRTSGTLLKHFAIKTPMMAYHMHNEAAATETLLTALTNGERIALISDAGTPLLSDPGARLVEAAIATGVRVTPIPGASALLPAVTMAGLPAGQFFYGGFLPVKSGARTSALEQWAHLPTTLVFYEAPHRLTDTLEDALTVLGDRPAAVAREITKLHEECVRGTIRELLAHFTATAPRGECVVLFHGAPETAAMDDATVDAALRDALKTLRVKEAAAQVATLSGRPKSDLYTRALALETGMTGTSTRLKNYRRGHRAERLAQLYLLGKAYLPLKRRYKTPVGEIDLIARRGRRLVFVEVKARKTVESAAESIHITNQQRVVRAAQYFLSQHPHYANYEIRFDAVLVAWYRWPRHIADAFR